MRHFLRQFKYKRRHGGSRSRAAEILRASCIGDKIAARSKTGTHKDNKYVVSIHSRAGEKESFAARFVVAAAEDHGGEKLGD